MKTNYKMLWIDDNFRTLRGDIRNFGQFFKRYGITYELIDLTPIPTEKIVQNNKFKTSIEDIELDIILIDYNMTEKESGSDIINHIRKTLHHYHIPILFYSGDGPRKIQELIFQSNTDKKNISDGIYFCDRDDIYKKTEAILISLLQKEEQPQRVRGLLMDRVSEIDAQIFEIIKSDIITDLTADDQDKLKNYILKKVRSRVSTSSSLLEEFQHKTLSEIMQSIIENPRPFDSMCRAEFVRKILAIKNPNCGNILSEFYNDLPNQSCINALRNIYAHQTEKEIGESHTTDRCKYIREETRKHLENLSCMESQPMNTNN